MRSTLRNPGIILPCALLALLCACGSSGGGGGNSNLSTDNPPVATAPAESTGLTTLTEYQVYSFTTSASDPDIGDHVASCAWVFGDGYTTTSTTPPFTVTHPFLAASSAMKVSVTPTDSHGVAGTTMTSTFVVAQAPNPFTVTPINPTTAVNVSLGSKATVSYAFSVVYTGSGTVDASSVQFTAGSSHVVAAPVVTTVGSLDGKTPWVVSVDFPAAAALTSPTSPAYTASPTLVLQDSLLVSSATITFPTVSVTTVIANPTPPTIAITTPVLAQTNIFALQTATVNFTVTDQGMFDVTAKVDWGDGATDLFLLSGTGLATGLAPSTTPTHQYTTPSATPYTVTVSATDTQQAPNNAAQSQTKAFLVAANALPTATITTPQASGTLPAAIDVFTPSSMSDQMYPDLSNPTANYPQVVVIPMNGQLNFSGVVTSPGSGAQDAAGTRWTFPGGNPGVVTNALSVTNVIFPGVTGKIVAYLVEFQAFDIYGRSSSQSGQGLPATPAVLKSAPADNTTPFRKWVVVDGTNTQTFYLNFLYRQKADVLQAAVPLAPVTTAANGYGASVQIFQDGVSNTFPVASGPVASLNAPVRSNLPFWISIPSFGGDTLSYTLEIPNAPTGPFMDPSLVAAATPPPDGAASFTFAAQAPYNPTLNLVTGQGYAPEGTPPTMIMLQGVYSLQGNDPATKMPHTDRWINFLSVPATDSAATSAVLDSVTANIFEATPAFLAIPEWMLAVKTVQPSTLPLETTAADANSTAEGQPSDLGFSFLFGTYAGPSAKSKTFTTIGLEAFRVPAGQNDPYNLTTGPASWNYPTCVTDLMPLQYSGSVSTVPAFFDTMLSALPGTTPLSGGLTGLTIPYDPNNPGGPLLPVPLTRNQQQGWPIFTVAEYLWSSVWVRPQVLNVANLSTTDTLQVSKYPYYRYSNISIFDPMFPSDTVKNGQYTQTDWPKYLIAPSITPDWSNFDLTPNPGGTFDAGTPVNTAATSASTSTPDGNAVGRFYWTAFNPKYNAPDGACIARTWLSDPTTNLIPTGFSNPDPKAVDANNALGFLPPLDPRIDKRARDAKGAVIAGAAATGFRVSWFNATKAADQATCVAPDFWAVELITNLGTNHFLLPASFPAAPTDGTTDNTQTTASPLLTDARYYLPSGNAPAAGPALTTTTPKVPTDTVAPGFCWFDVPPELRPTTGTAQVIIFALKSVLANHPTAGAYPRPLNRTDWIDAIKTATATISVLSNTGKDLAYAYKVPFNYGWDIVVTNCEATTVAP